MQNRDAETSLIRSMGHPVTQYLEGQKMGRTYSDFCCCAAGGVRERKEERGARVQQEQGAGAAAAALAQQSGRAERRGRAAQCPTGPARAACAAHHP